MANFNTYYISSDGVYSTSNQDAKAVAYLTQSVSTANRQVTVTLRGLIGCYRKAAWNCPANTNVLGQSYGLASNLDGSTASMSNAGLKSGSAISMVSGGTYTYDSGLTGYGESGSVRSVSKTYNYNDNGDAITGSFSVTINNGGATISGTFTTSSIDPAYSAPTGLDASISNITDKSAKVTMSITSYGYPASTSGRYIQGAILGTSTYGDPYRYANVSNSTTGWASLTNSSSTGSPALTIQGNTEYYYGVYANNTVKDASLVKGTFVTLPAYISSVSYVDNGHGSITFSPNYAAEGSKYTVQNKYSLDQSTWTNMGSSVTLNFENTTTVYFKRSSTAGDTTVKSVTVTPQFNRFVYVGVNGASKKSKKIYVGVNGASKEVKKIYAGVNGVSKLVYKAT